MKKALLTVLLVVCIIATFAFTACDNTPAELVLDAPAITIEGKTISWEAVTNATGYEVYRNSTSVVKQVGTSYEVTDTAEGDYDYYVKAIATVESATVTSAKSNTVTYTVEGNTPGGGTTEPGDESAWTLGSVLLDATLGYKFQATVDANYYDTNLYQDITDHDGDVNNTLIITLTNTGDKDLFVKAKVEFEGSTDQTAKYGEITLDAESTVTVYVDVTGIDATRIFLFPDLGAQSEKGEASFTIDTCEFANIVTLAKPVIALDEAVISWEAVAEAESYDIYCNDELVTNQTELTYTITDTEEGVYKYTVVASTVADGYVNSAFSNEVSYIVGEPVIPNVTLNAWETTDSEFVLETVEGKLNVTYTGVVGGSYKNIYASLVDYNAIYTKAVVVITNTTDSEMTMRVGIDEKGGVDYASYDNATIVIGGNSTATFVLDVRNTLYTPTSLKLYPDTDANSKADGAFTVESVAFYTAENAPVALDAPVLTLDGNEFTWLSVDNATSYDIYCNGEFVVNQTDLSYVIDQTVDGVYSYTVVACTTNEGFLESLSSTSVKYTVGEVVLEPALGEWEAWNMTSTDTEDGFVFEATVEGSYGPQIFTAITNHEGAKHNRMTLTLTNTGDVTITAQVRIDFEGSTDSTAKYSDIVLEAGKTVVTNIDVTTIDATKITILSDRGTQTEVCTASFTVDTVEFAYVETLTAPVATIEGNVISWNAVENADRYNVFCGTVWVTNVAITSYTLADDATEGDYTIVAQSDDSASYTDSVASNVVTYPMLGEKLDAPVLTLDGNEFTWLSVEKATSYDIYCNGEFVVNQTELSYVIDQTVDGVYSYTVVANTTTEGFVASLASEAVEYIVGVVVVEPAFGTWAEYNMTSSDTEDGYVFNTALTGSYDQQIFADVTNHEGAKHNRIVLTFTNTGATELLVKAKVEFTDSTDATAKYGELTLAVGATETMYIDVNDINATKVTVFPNLGEQTEVGVASLTLDSATFYNDVPATSTEPTLTVAYPDNVTENEGVYTFTFTATDAEAYATGMAFNVTNFDVTKYNRMKITYTNEGETAVVVGTKVAVSATSADGTDEVGYGGDATLAADASEIIYINIEFDSFGYIQIFPDKGTTAGEATISFTIEFYYDAPVVA